MSGAPGSGSWCQSGNYLRIWAGSRELNANRRALFANESDGYKTTSAPSAFRSSCGRSAWIGEEPTPEQSERHYRNCHQEDYLTAEQLDVAAVIEEVQLKCFNAKTETSSAADPATDFRPFANSPRSLANNFRIDNRGRSRSRVRRRELPVKQPDWHECQKR